MDNNNLFMQNEDCNTDSQWEYISEVSDQLNESRLGVKVNEVASRPTARLGDVLFDRQSVVQYAA